MKKAVHTFLVLTDSIPGFSLCLFLVGEMAGNNCLLAEYMVFARPYMRGLRQSVRLVLGRAVVSVACFHHAEVVQSDLGTLPWGHAN